MVVVHLVVLVLIAHAEISGAHFVDHTEAIDSKRDDDFRGSGFSFEHTLGVTSMGALRAQTQALLGRVALVDDNISYPALTISEVQMPWEDKNNAPLSSCKTTGWGTEANLLTAVERFCSAGLGDLVEFFVDSRFKSFHDDEVDEDGWIPEAFVTYVGSDGLADENRLRLLEQADLLLQSVHNFSSRPVVVANFGRYLPAEWTPNRFPRMILFHGRKIRSNGMMTPSFSLNKHRAMMFTMVSVGLFLDADQWIIRGTDYMFRRAAEEGGSGYKYPIQPVHWMSRDPASGDMPRYAFSWSPDEIELGAPNRTMRWGHAHPTWTRHALDFIAKWTVFALSDQDDRKEHNGKVNPLGVFDERARAPSWFRHLVKNNTLQDEDVMNFALWSENRTKQWCKFDVPGYGDFDQFWAHQKTTNRFADPTWFPKGIPLVFFHTDDAKNPNRSSDDLKLIWSDTDNEPAIFYDGRWFNSADDLRLYEPMLKCMA